MAAAEYILNENYLKWDHTVLTIPNIAAELLTYVTTKLNGYFQWVASCMYNPTSDMYRAPKYLWTFSR